MPVGGGRSSIFKIIPGHMGFLTRIGGIIPPLNCLWFDDGTGGIVNPWDDNDVWSECP